MNSSITHVFITGGTGTIGSHLASLLLNDPLMHLTLLARDKGSNTALSRITRALGSIREDDLPVERLRILKGDVSESKFGLTDQEYSELVDKTNLIIHSAATTKLSESEETCRRMNVKGTETTLLFAKDAQHRGCLQRLCHISTAYVAGNRLPDKLMEDNLPQNPEFSNYYERSKYEAEFRVREEASRGLPVTIFRPSVVVGDSVTGRPASFNVLYPLCRLLASGMLSKIPVHLNSTINIVPLDFVVQCIQAISCTAAGLGKTYHLVTKDPPPLRNILDLQDHYPHLAYIFQRTEVVDPDTFDATQLPEDERILYDGLAAYLPYLENHLAFDTTNMDAILPQLGLQWPDTSMKFARKLFEYVIEVGYIPTD